MQISANPASCFWHGSLARRGRIQESRLLALPLSGQSPLCSRLQGIGTRKPISMADSVLAPGCTTYVKDGQLLLGAPAPTAAPAAGQECATTLSVGAIVGELPALEIAG